MRRAAALVLLFSFDQIFKFFAFQGLLPRTGGLLAYVCNPYISWGIPVLGWVFWTNWVIATALLIYLLTRYNKNIWLVVVLAGSVSNIADRIFRGCVVDYFRLPAGNFPIFNLADVFIVMGIGIFLAREIFFRKRI